MNGKQLYNFYISKRNFTGGTEDTYAQYLTTLYFHVSYQLFPLLEKADELSKKLHIIEHDDDFYHDSYSTNDILFI
ncbi:hypothetical protein [Aestuariibaculum sediminum]|uniref:Uncharacterized protein n=1 Tax=Aestuariibaculum sediminum TaxID=2770637 RepID=A0A8J6U8S0_9FLAO|nr:hypothetical protein [Aestuariibaculum sediminum]MBD0833368.1 hypothetical protein [Aestuariibaculum sediminum]